MVFYFLLELRGLSLERLKTEAETKEWMACIKATVEIDDAAGNESARNNRH